ncbi:MAG: DUF349 domain-containing protein [Bacteroidales bacterium]|nr:DUF349 domain-containing protein [Bacteroidales bacterium]
MKNVKQTTQNPEPETYTGQEEQPVPVNTVTEQPENVIPADLPSVEETVAQTDTPMNPEPTDETAEIKTPDDPGTVEIPVADDSEPVVETITENQEIVAEVKAIAEPTPEPVAETVPDIASGTNPEKAPETMKDGAQTEMPEPLIDLEERLDEHLDDHSEEHLEALGKAVAEQNDQEGATNYEALSRSELVDLLEKTVSEPDINAVKARVALIKVAFLKKKKEENLLKYENAPEEGTTKEELDTDQDELDVKFNNFFSIYKTNKAKYLEEQEKIKLENLKQKFLILDELKTLISSEETLKKTYDEFKILQERWKEVGMVPRTEINNLWQNYHFLVEKFFEKVKLNKELKDLDLRKNLEAKIGLCEKTEELLLETSVLKSFKKLQKLHEEWKEIGPVPADKKDEIWERFKTATDKINDRRREHYALIEEDQVKNLETKTALCDQAEVVIGLPNESIKEWQENTNKVNDLLKIWKNIGPVPQKVNAEIWNRFKTSLDTFFSNKKEYFDKLKEQQLHNYNLKVELCMQAESLKSSTDWKKTTNELIHLQGEWKNIGPVPKKHSDKIWKRFRAACDDFFNSKQSFFSNIQASEEENLNKKLDVMKRLREYQFTEDKPANLEVLKNFQREWTEIGHIPIKEKDKLQNEFRSLINENLDKLKISDVEMSAVNFQVKVDHMKNDPNARRVISKEREFLANRITKMKEEIILWENNIGFFAKSKSASLVKEEFENKINKAKSELKVLEAKMKILRQQ